MKGILKYISQPARPFLKVGLDNWIYFRLENVVWNFNFLVFRYILAINDIFRSDEIFVGLGFSFVDKHTRYEK